LDLDRAVRFVRKNAAVYGTALDAGYAPDELDGISADATADGMIYSFYDRPHGYGYTEGWIPVYAEWLSDIFNGN